MPSRVRRIKNSAGGPAPDQRTLTIPRNEALRLLRAMHEIRFFEDEIQALFSSGAVRGSTHLYQGQEAVAVGACSVLRRGDAMVCTYRGHGAVLAMGAPLDRAFGEILGKENGLCRGKGGSMHLADVSTGAYGSFAIVGSHLPIGTGLALAAKYRRDGSVTLCFFGDGAANIGAFHESLNLASIWKLPVIFVCENNLYGEYSPIAVTTSILDLVNRADAYGMAKNQVDGNELLTVRAAVQEAAKRARSGDGPSLIEARTYRQRGHSRSDLGTYRPPGELEAWLKRDPILLFEKMMLVSGVPESTLESVKEGSLRQVREALARADAWPEPPMDARFEDVFV